MVLFRAESLQHALNIYKLVFEHFDISLAGQWAQKYTLPLVIMLLAYVLHYTPMKWNEFVTRRFIALHWTLKAVAVFVGILLIYQAFSSDTQPFIYLEF